MIHGLLNVCKEPGMTSHDVVARVRRLLHQKKIGHTGTLDPDAAGVLVLCLGDATKLSDQLSGYSKEYIALCRLGITTDTEDLSGRVLTERSVSVDAETLKQTVARFKGTYEQTPPMYSAIRVDGKHLYELAREGKEIERKKRSVTIEAISVADTSMLDTEHLFTMEVRCSKGTYIRTLCADIGEALGCGAAMAHLTRTAVGSFHLAEALTLDNIGERYEDGTLEDAVMPIEAFYRDLDVIHTKEETDKALHNGNALPLDGIRETEISDDADDGIAAEEMYPDGTRVRAYDHAGTFCGVFFYDARRRQFKADKFFYHADHQ